MRKWFLWVLAAVFLFTGAVPVHPSDALSSLPAYSAPQENAAYAEGEVLVTLLDPEEDELTTEGTTSFDESIRVEESWAFENEKNVPGKSKEADDGTLYISQVCSDEYSTEELIEELEDQDHVLSVEPNYYRHKLSVSPEPYADQQWYLDGEGVFHTSSSGIHYKETTSLSGQADPVVAVVDTGIDYTHEDLAAHMWTNPYPSSALGGTYGYDFGDSDADPMDDDEDGHGTHCAGVISGISDNQTGITGISNARLMALKVFDHNGEARDSSIIAAFNYIYRAQSLGVNIAAINCSWGGGGATPSSIRSLIEKIGANGSLFIFAAGNDGINHDTSGQTDTPYDLNSNYVVTVGAINQQEERASFSDYGKQSVHLFAPGELIFSTVNDGIFSPATYPEARRNSLCTFFTSYDSFDTPIYTAPEVGLSGRSVSYLGKSYSDEDFYGSTDSGSVCISIRAVRNLSSIELFLDVTGLSLDRSQTYHLAYDLGTKENGVVLWDHYTVTSTANHFVTKGGRTYLRLVGLSGNFRQTSELYLDNLGISRAGLPSSSFDKYNTMSGTSMAAPQAAGAVALLASVYPADSVAERRARLLNCVRQTDSLSACCMTGGILDLGKISTASTTLPLSVTQNEGTQKKTEVVQKTTKKLVKKVKLNKKKATLRYGKKLKLKATVTPKDATNKKVKWYVSNKKYAKVTQKGVVKAKKKGIGHTVKVYAKAKDKSGKKAYCKVRLKKSLKKRKS